jgi:glyoxylase-like metal-dependent hydrolase (beta-lactamase superfamily II)
MQLAPGIYSIPQSGKRTYPSGHVQAYLLDDGKDLTLIDTLADPDAQLIVRELERIGRPVTDIKRIILTHAHRSHLGGLATLKRVTGATVYVLAIERRSPCRSGPPRLCEPLRSGWD